MDSKWDICSYGIAAVVPFSHRLAYDGVSSHLQQLRCKVNFHALRFVDKITKTGDLIIGRLRSRDIKNEEIKWNTALKGDSAMLSGKFLALHLRFDKVGWLKVHIFLPMLLSMADTFVLNPGHFFARETVQSITSIIQK
jgi:hypothetical protein